MRKIKLVIFFVLAASLLLAGCQAESSDPKSNAVVTTPAVTEPTAGPNMTTQKGSPTICEIRSLIPEVPADQIPPVPPASDSDWIIGSKNAEISLIEYTDFQCPYCSLAAPELERFQAAFADRVNLVIRHFPLTSIHDRAMPAARAAEAAGVQGKFFEMHDALFQNQSEWGAQGFSVDQFDQYVTDLAEKLGLKVDQFKQDYVSSAIQAKVDQAYKDAADKIGLSSTPSVFIVINGVPYKGPYDYESLKGILDLIDYDKHTYKECPPMVIDPAKEYTATIKTTKGDIIVALYPDKAPLTVNSFVFLAREGYFDNIAFHRVMPGFVAQTGDPLGSGMGGPGYEFANEISDLKFDSEGVLGMANAGVDTNGSQFFITYAAQPDLDGDYTVFGKVIQNMDVVNNLAPVNPQSQGPKVEPDRILSITITEK